jgi:hypothetical protein
MKKTILLALGLSSALFFSACSTEKQAEDTAATETSIVDSAVIEETAPLVEVIKLEETPGAFATTNLSLKAGQPYTFEVTNKGIDKEVAFVLAPKPADAKASVEDIMKTAIGDAGLTNMVNKDQTASSKAPVTLEAGEYIYFCPLNGTPQYTVTVQ